MRSKYGARGSRNRDMVALALGACGSVGDDGSGKSDNAGEADRGRSRSGW